MAAEDRFRASENAIARDLRSRVSSDGYGLRVTGQTQRSA